MKKNKYFGLARKIHNTKRIIKKRMRIADLWKFDLGHGKGENQYKGQENRLNKFNLNCGCKMCKSHKYTGNSKDRFKYSDKKKLINEIE